MTKKEVLDWLYRIKSKLTMYFPIKWVSECEQAIDYAIKALENQKTGHWEYVQYDSNPKIGNYHCSVCRHIINPFENQKYCPNCGAKMEGE